MLLVHSAVVPAAGAASFAAASFAAAAAAAAAATAAATAVAVEAVDAVVEVVLTAAVVAVVAAVVATAVVIVLVFAVVLLLSLLLFLSLLSFSCCCLFHYPYLHCQESANLADSWKSWTHLEVNHDVIVAAALLLRNLQTHGLLLLSCASLGPWTSSCLPAC